MTMVTPKSRVRTLLGQLYVQVLIGIAIGCLIGIFCPHLGVSLKPFGDGFIKLIRMLLAPVIFGTVVVGISKMGDLKAVGRVGLKALIYFEIVSTIALAIGLVTMNIVKPGVGMNIDASAIDSKSIATYTAAAKTQDATSFFMNIIPDTIVDAFAKGNMLQVILFSVLLGVGLVQLGPRGKNAVDFIDTILQALFRIVALVMWLAPIGAGAGMAFTIGQYGIGSLRSLGALMLSVYATSLLFVFLVLAPIMRWAGISFLAFLRYIREEILITFGTCSTEAVLPRMMGKLERLGCEKSVVGMVLPAGYTFNADGTSIYLTMAAIFVAQATNTPLTLTDQLIVLGVLLLTSKGSAGVAGAGFVTLAATLSSMDKVPVAGLVLLLGVDRFINEARAVINLIGNGVATVFIARWEGAFDLNLARHVLSGDSTTPAVTEGRDDPIPAPSLEIPLEKA
jgi:aerobic C4-dicarboxylate transport protein